MSTAPRKRVVLLGSTGSIGTSAMQVVERLTDQLDIVGIAAHSNIELLAEQAKASGASAVCIYDQRMVASLRQLLPAKVRVLAGPDGLVELASMESADIVLVAIVGTAGLAPALAAIEAGKDLAVASKEILVMAGEVITQAAAKHGVNILPVDSEHNAIFQCLEGRRAGEISRLILTASGGPFRTLPREKLAEVTPAQALRHPTWAMGPKISIDSATLFNKGLEMIEAMWLFGLEMSCVDVIVHPQSIVHSMVEFCDGSVLAQLSHSDMQFPIQYALTWPRRYASGLRPLDFAALGQLDFEAPRDADFPALQLARSAGSQGGTMPAVYNAANEVAVARFRAGAVPFPAIWESVAAVMEDHSWDQAASLSAVIEADRWAREKAAAILQNR